MQKCIKYRVAMRTFQAALDTRKWKLNPKMLKVDIENAVNILEELQKRWVYRALGGGGVYLYFERCRLVPKRFVKCGRCCYRDRAVLCVLMAEVR